jgi:Zn ribbon nucleic-acid-binding protein
VCYASLRDENGEVIEPEKQCMGENSLSARECVHCGSELSDPNSKLILHEAAQLTKRQNRQALQVSTVNRITARESKNAVMLIYETDEGKRISDFINPESDKPFMLRKTKEVLSEMRIPNLESRAAIISAINKGLARTPKGISWRKKDGSEFIDVRERHY